MDRRRFLLTSLAGAVSEPLAAEAQQATNVVRIGWLGRPTRRSGLGREAPSSRDYVVARRAEIIELAARHRLPAIYALREWVEDGGLISYATNLSDQWRRAARYVDKILKGSRPSDLPIEQPAAFELWINLKTAKALGLAIPASLRLRADQVIE